MRDDERFSFTVLELRPIGWATVSVVRYAACGLQREHSHDRPAVSMLVRGALVETAERRQVRARALSWSIKPAGVEHADRFGPTGAELLSIQLDPNRLDGTETPSMGDWHWGNAGRVARACLALLAELRSRVETPADVESRAAEVLAALPEQQERRPPPSAPGWLRQVADEVEDTWSTRPSVRRLADRVGRHPVTLARRYRQCFGISITEHVRRLQVQRAAELLATDGDPLSEVAVRCGFADQSHLTRIMKSATGLPPLRYRRLARPPGR